MHNSKHIPQSGLLVSILRKKSLSSSCLNNYFKHRFYFFYNNIGGVEYMENICNEQIQKQKYKLLKITQCFLIVIIFVIGVLQFFINIESAV